MVNNLKPNSQFHENFISVYKCQQCHNKNPPLKDSALKKTNPVRLWVVVAAAKEQEGFFPIPIRRSFENKITSRLRTGKVSFRSDRGCFYKPSCLHKKANIVVQLIRFHNYPRLRPHQSRGGKPEGARGRKSMSLLSLPPPHTQLLAGV